MIRNTKLIKLLIINNKKNNNFKLQNKIMKNYYKILQIQKDTFFKKWKILINKKH